MLNTLNVAQSGLNASKVAVENIMNNIANENTPGYKKRTTILNELAHIDSRVTGRGVQVGGIVRANDHYMYTNLIDEGTKESYFARNNTMFESIEALFKETDESGFSADLNRYFKSIGNMRDQPNNEVYKNSMKTEGKNLVDGLKRLYEGIEKQEELTKNSLNDDLEAVNKILQDIGKINEQLGRQFDASNDLLDKRDQLELELSKYIDIDVNRSLEDYELKVAGVTAIRHSTNVREITLAEMYEPQVDRYVNDDGTSSSLLNGVTFDNNDIITFKIDNESSVSVQFGESMTFDLDGDGTVETITVDATNYVRALVNKINTSTDISQKVTAYNGPYSVDKDGNKSTLDTVDKFLYIEGRNSGTKHEFDSRISFVERPLDIYTSTTDEPLSVGSISTDKKKELAAPPQQDMTHTVSLNGSSITAQEFDFSITDGTAAAVTNFDLTNMTFTNGVTYDDVTGKITVPAGVTSFDVNIPVVNDSVAGDKDYTINIGGQSATGTIQDVASATEVVKITSEKEAEGNNLVHTVSLSGPTVAAQTFDIDLQGVSAELGVDFSALAAGSFSPAPVSFTAPIPPATIGTVEFPPGTTSFTITINAPQDTAGEIDETYTLSVDDGTNTVNATGTIEDDDQPVSKLIYRNAEQSDDAKDIIGIAIYDDIVTASSGSLKAQVENLHTDSGNNKFTEFKNQLDQFAFALADMSKNYIKNGDDDYVYGSSAIDDLGTTRGNVRELNLFTGSSVKDLVFNEDAVNDLDQEDMEYLATFQFKKDIAFNGKPQGSTNPDYADEDKSSFAEFFQALRVGVSETKESNDFLLTTQKTVKQSIQSSYDQLVKVDKDEEMILLVKFQAAYTANAKVITVVDEMLQTILGLKR
jgi:flagellar hook-associated protein 1 FlgK